MATQRSVQLSLILAAGVLASACNDHTEMPTAAAPDASLQAQHSMMGMTTVASSTDPLVLTPFTFRAPLAPFKIQQLPDFMIHSKETSDIVIQRSIFNPGAGMWHTHPGPSFVYVIEGEIRLDRSSREGCWSTPVRGPGQAYFEVANEVHRAVVTSAIPAVVLVTRFNIPPGAAITVPAADPGC